MTIVAAAEHKKRALANLNTACVTWLAFTRQRLDEVILLRMPSLNPSGLILYSD